MKTDTFIQNSLGKDISENLGYTLCQWQSFIKGITTDPHTVSIFIKLNTPKSFFPFPLSSTIWCRCQMRTTEDIIISPPLFCNCFKPVVSIVLNSLLFYMCHYIHTNVIWNQIYLFNKFQQEVHIHNWDHLLLNHALSVFGITQFFTQDKRYRGALPPLMNQQASFELLKNTLKTWQSKWILLML